MSGVMKEWKCGAHGYFDSTEARCPKGCTAVSQVFLTPVGTRSDKTKHADSNLRQIAMDFGMGDIRSAREGESARVKTKAQREAEALQQKLQHRFAPLAKGGTFNSETKKSTTANGGALASMATHKAQPTPEVAAVREAFIHPTHSPTQNPKMTIVKRDPDRESRQKVMAA